MRAATDTTPETRRYRSTFRLPFHEAGPGGYVGITSIANCLQQAAGDHADRLEVGAPNHTPHDLIWVLTRQYVRIDRMPLGGELIGIETWPSARPRQLFQRDFLVTGEDGAVIAAATSTWVLVDTESRKAARPPQWLLERIVHDPDRAVGYPTRSLARLEAGTLARPITPRWSDLDLNGHVNNAILTGWVLEALPYEQHRRSQLTGIDIGFRAECTHEHRVRSEAAAQADGTHLHALVREDGVEIARAASWWAPAASDGQP